MVKHGPIEKRAGSSSISIPKRVIVCQPKMQNNSPDDRVNKKIWRLLIRKLAHRIEPLLQFLCWRRIVKHVSFIIAHKALFAWGNETPAPPPLLGPLFSFFSVSK